MAYYKVTMRGGRTAGDDAPNLVRYYEAQDMLTAFLSALTLSRVRRSPAGTGIYAVEPVDAEQFHRGKMAERRDPVACGRG
jgi:hypothetical protein